jgi:hypothetical protein
VTHEDIDVSNYDIFFSYDNCCMIDDRVMSFWVKLICNWKENNKKCHNIIDIVGMFMTYFEFNKSKFLWRINILICK